MLLDTGFLGTNGFHWTRRANSGKSGSGFGGMGLGPMSTVVLQVSVAVGRSGGALASPFPVSEFYSGWNKTLSGSPRSAGRAT